MSVETLNRLEPTSSPERSIYSVAVLSAGFSLTGSGTVMLGVILPAISSQWGFRDHQLGTLLFLQFFGSGLGAVATGLNRVRSLVIGYGLLVVTLCALLFGGSGLAYPAFFLYGLGLGMAITGTSQLFSDRWRDDRASKLEWLNFAWSAGATAAPICFLPFLRHNAFRSVFVLMLWLFLGMFCWVLFLEHNASSAAILRTVRQPNRSTKTVFAAFLILAMGFVGVEASMSGWLTTYSNRAGIHNLAGASLATSLFWLGEMLSRLTFSTRLLAKLGRPAVLTWGILGVTASASALIAFPNPWAILVVAGAAGFCVGPLYPLALSY